MSLFLLEQEEKAICRYHLLLVSVSLLVICVLMSLRGTCLSKSYSYQATDLQKVVKFGFCKASCIQLELSFLKIDCFIAFYLKCIQFIGNSSEPVRSSAEDPHNASARAGT